MRPLTHKKARTPAVIVDVQALLERTSTDTTSCFFQLLIWRLILSTLDYSLAQFNINFNRALKAATFGLTKKQCLSVVSKSGL